MHNSAANSTSTTIGGWGWWRSALPPTGTGCVIGFLALSSPLSTGIKLHGRNDDHTDGLSDSYSISTLSLCHPPVSNGLINGRLSADFRGSDVPLVLDEKVAEWRKVVGGVVNDLVVANAKSMLQLVDRIPDRIAVSADESIILSFETEASLLLVEFFASGEIAAVLQAGETEHLFDSNSPAEAANFISSTLGPV